MLYVRTNINYIMSVIRQLYINDYYSAKKNNNKPTLYYKVITLKKKNGNDCEFQIIEQRCCLQSSV